VLQSRPLVHGFSWKTAFYRGAVVRISSRLRELRSTVESNASVTALCCEDSRRTPTGPASATASRAARRDRAATSR